MDSSAQGGLVRRLQREHAAVRYGLAVAAVAVAFGLRALLEPITGSGSHFVLFYAAVLVTTIAVGSGPGLLVMVLGGSLAAYAFLYRAGVTAFEASTQVALFFVDCLIIIYIVELGVRARLGEERAAERMRQANAAASIRNWELDVATGGLSWSPDEAPHRRGTAETLDQWVQAIDPRERAAFEDALHRSLDTRGDGELRVEARLADSGRWFNWVGHTVFEVQRGKSVAVRQVGSAIDVTERRAREEMLRELTVRLGKSEAYIRELIELAPDAFFLADLDAHFIDVNQAACRMLGYSREELVGKTILDIIPPEDAPRLMETRSKLLEPGKIDRGAWRQVRKDGTVVDVEVSSNILPDGRWQAFARDVTQRKALEEQRQVFQALLENSPDFIGIADPSGKPIWGNPAALRMVGLPPDFDVRQTQIRDYYPPEVRGFVDDVIVKEMMEKGRWSGETFFRNWQTGASIPVSDVHFNIRDPTGKVLGTGTITRDISEQRQRAREREELLAREQTANAKLRESEERFRTLAEAVPQMVWMTTPDGLNIYFNQKWVDYTGLTLEESYGNGWNKPFHPDDRQKAWETWERAVQTDGAYSLECRLRRADGVYRWWLIRGVSLHDQNGKVINWFGTCTDIEDIKQAELAVSRARDEAEQTNKRLRESEERFRLTIDEAPIGMTLVGLDGRFFRVNQALCEITGYLPRSLPSFASRTSPTPKISIPTWLLSESSPAVRSQSTNSKSATSDKDKSVVWIMLSASILRGTDGKPIYYIAQIEDVSERKIADQALKASQARFAGIISPSPEAIISIDEAQRITLFNEGAEKIFGYPRDEVMGASLGLLIPHRLREAHRRDVDAFAAGEVQARTMAERVADIRGRRKSGEAVLCGGLISKLTVSGQTIFTVVMRDVTERRRLEWRQRFMTEASELLGASLDYSKTLAGVAKLVVREFSDWCIVKLAPPGSSELNWEVAGSTPAMNAIGLELEELPVSHHWPAFVRPAGDGPHPVLIERIQQSDLQAIAQSPEHLRVLQHLDAASLMDVPLLIRGQVLGALVFISSDPSRTFHKDDLELAQALAERATLAVEMDASTRLLCRPPSSATRCWRWLRMT